MYKPWTGQVQDHFDIIKKGKYLKKTKFYPDFLI